MLASLSPLECLLKWKQLMHNVRELTIKLWHEFIFDGFQSVMCSFGQKLGKMVNFVETRTFYVIETIWWKQDKNLVFAA